MLYSGHEEENAPHTEGVALMLSHQAYNALIGWEAFGIRMMLASYKTRMEKIQLIIILCYAPTNDKDEGTKEDFYNRRQTFLDKMKEKYITVLMGAFNNNNTNNITSMTLKSSEARAQKRNKTKSVIIFKSRGHTGVIISFKGPPTI